MFKLCIFVILLSVLGATLGGIELPPEFIKCGRKDPNFNECLQRASVKAIQLMGNGYPLFGIDSIDPLVIKSMEIGNENTGTSVNVRQKYTNFKSTGALKMKVNNVKANLDTKCKVLIDAFLPTLNFDGDYELQGKVLLLPIAGKGKVNFSMKDVAVQSLIKCEKYVDNNENYYRATDFKVDISPKNVTMNFENLFNDKQLSDNMNKVLNENWAILFDDAKKDYEEEFSKVFKDITNKIFSKVPEDKIFLN